jgi:hypothetical protein
MNRRVPRSLVAVAVILLSVTPLAQTVRKPAPVFRSGTELVLVNVVVRDRNGAIVRGLRQEDFALSEDDKAQTITSFDFEEPDRATPQLTAPETPAVFGATPHGRQRSTRRGHRSIRRCGRRRAGDRNDRRR